jgi:hypothetical protein
MRRAQAKRRHRPDLIARPPLGGVGVERQWDSLIIDPVQQLVALTELCDRGLISSDELASQRRRILGLDTDAPGGGRP